MSIINDALKALEKKRQQEKPSQSSLDRDVLKPPAYVDVANEERKKHYLWMGVSCVAAVAVLALIIGIQRHNHHALLPESGEPLSHLKHENRQGVVGSMKQSEIKAPIGQLSKRKVRYVLSQLTEAVKAHDSGRFRDLIQHVHRQKDWREELAVMVSQLESDRNFQMAENLLDGFRQLSPDDIALREVLAHLYVDEGNAGKAVEFLKSDHVAIEKHVDYYALLAYTLMKAKRYSESATVYQQLVSIDSSRASWWMGLGVSYLYQGKAQEALASFERSKSHAPPNAPYRYYLSQKIHELGGG